MEMKKAAARSRPGTAVQSRGRHRADEILRAARAVLVEEGYAAMTTRKIAERVRIRQSNVQYYFPTKADLVRALFQAAVAQDSGARARRMRRATTTPRQRLIGSLDQFLRSHHSLEQQRFLRDLWALSAHDPDVAEVMNTFYREWIDLVARTLLAINPKLGRGRARRRALLIISVVDGLSLFHGAVGVDHPALAGIEGEARRLVLGLAQTPT
jgi:AcrR family transcriptional regulator